MRHISHEIRTPLNTVFLGLQVLDQDIKKIGFSKNIISTIKEVQSSCNVSIEVLDEMLLFDKLSEGILKLEKTILPAFQFIQDVINPFYIQVNTNIYISFLFNIYIYIKYMNNLHLLFVCFPSIID